MKNKFHKISIIFYCLAFLAFLINFGVLDYLVKSNADMMAWMLLLFPTVVSLIFMCTGLILNIVGIFNKPNEDKYKKFIKSGILLLILSFFIQYPFWLLAKYEMLELISIFIQYILYLFGIIFIGYGSHLRDQKVSFPWVLFGLIIFQFITYPILFFDTKLKYILYYDDWFYLFVFVSIELIVILLLYFNEKGKNRKQF